MSEIVIRHAEASDYAPIVAVVNDWWGGRTVSAMLPKLFFVHFHETSFIAEKDGERVGFLIGFLSQTLADEAYIHFIGVHPDYRMAGVARLLYEHFFEAVRQQGRHTIHSVTSPHNTRSIAFHQRMGFQIEPSTTQKDGISYQPDYDGIGHDRVVFVRHLA